MATPPARITRHHFISVKSAHAPSDDDSLVRALFACSGAIRDLSLHCLAKMSNKPRQSSLFSFLKRKRAEPENEIEDEDERNRLGEDRVGRIMMLSIHGERVDINTACSRFLVAKDRQK